MLINSFLAVFGMKKLKYTPDLVPLILDGSKRCTWRLFDDKQLRCGDICSFLDSETLEQFATAELTSVKETRFRYLTDEDWEGHERYPCEELMYQTYSAYYGQKVDEDTILKIIKFKLL